MAKQKSVKELKADAKKIRDAAKKQEAELLKKAAELELKLYADLGKKCVDFLNKKVELSELESYAINNELVDETILMSDDLEENISSSDETLKDDLEKEDVSESDFNGYSYNNNNDDDDGRV